MKKLLLVLAVLGAATFSYSAETAPASDDKAADKQEMKCDGKDCSCCKKDDKGECAGDCCKQHHEEKKADEAKK